MKWLTAEAARAAVAIVLLGLALVVAPTTVRRVCHGLGDLVPVAVVAPSALR